MDIEVPLPFSEGGWIPRADAQLLIFSQNTVSYQIIRTIDVIHVRLGRDHIEIPIEM